MVECNLAKVDVEGSNPFSRSKNPEPSRPVRAEALAGFSFQGATCAGEGATEGATNSPAEEERLPRPNSWMTLQMLARCSSGETVE